MPRPAETADPEALAIRALGFLAGDPQRLSRFLDLTGLTPTTLRQAAGEPGFLLSVLDHLLTDESLLLAFAAEAGVPPEAVAAASRRMGGLLG